MNASVVSIKSRPWPRDELRSAVNDAALLIEATQSFVSKLMEFPAGGGDIDFVDMVIIETMLEKAYKRCMEVKEVMG